MASVIITGVMIIMMIIIIIIIVHWLILVAPSCLRSHNARYITLKSLNINQCCFIVDWNLSKIFHWYLNTENTKISFDVKALKMSNGKWRPFSIVLRMLIFSARVKYRPLGQSMGVFGQFEVLPTFFLISCRAGCNIALYCTAIYRESIVSRPW